MIKTNDKVDKKFLELGFKKVAEDDNIVQYEKRVDKYVYTHCIDILRKSNGNHIIQSYSKEDDLAVVGMTKEEMKLSLKKLKHKGW